MKIKRIMLIRPGVPLPWGVYTQPLGLMYLISVLRRDFPGQFEIDLVEQALYKLTFAQMRERMKAFKPDLVGFSCISLEAGEMARLARIARELNPECLIILGGPHAKFFYDHALDTSDVDIAVIGEAERTFPELLTNLTAGRPLDGIKGLAFKRGGRMVINPPREQIADLDTLPLPAWDLIDFGRYSKVRSMNGYCRETPWAVIATSRGCPFHCAYCHDIFGKKARLRSPENVLAEIELLTGRYGVKELHIIDDIFNVDLARAKRICDLIVEKGIKVHIAFPNALRADMMDRELIQKLKKAGCYVITYAIESASPRIQKLINKDLDLEKARRVISWTSAESIIPHGFFMIGFPGETTEEMEMTAKWALDTELWAAIFFMVVLYPRNRLFEIAKETYPHYDFGKWDMQHMEYRAGIPFYQKATGVDISGLYLRIIRRIALKFAGALMRYVPFPQNMRLLLVFIWKALPRVSSTAARIESLFYPPQLPYPAYPAATIRKSPELEEVR